MSLRPGVRRHAAAFRQDVLAGVWANGHAADPTGVAAENVAQGRRFLMMLNMWIGMYKGALDVSVHFHQINLGHRITAPAGLRD